MGKFEEFTKSFNEMCLHLKIENKDSPYINTSPQKKSINLDEEILIKAYNKHDVKLYNEFFSVINDYKK